MGRPREPGSGPHWTLGCPAARKSAGRPSSAVGNADRTRFPSDIVVPAASLLQNLPRPHKLPQTLRAARARRGATWTPKKEATAHGQNESSHQAPVHE